MLEEVITKKELLEYIASFNKNKGEYTSDELYYIGRKHKMLPLQERDWEWLTSLVGYQGKAETYRTKVKKRQFKEGELPISESSIGLANMAKMDDEDISEKFVELYKQQTKTRDTLNSYRREIREEARIESLKDFIAESINELSKLPKINFNTENVVSRKKEAVLLLSDLHIGVCCNNFYNKYNKEIALERLNRLANKVVEYCQTNKVECLNVCNLGDLIQGIIHTSSRIEQEIDVVQQMILSGEYIANFLNSIQRSCPKIIYRSVTDNHSRSMASKEEHIEKENFNKIIDWYLKERLKNTDIIFAEDNIDDTIGRFEINGKCIMFAHGHLDNINQAFQHFVGATQQYVDYILLGHYHCEKAKSYQGTKVIVNGSIVGTEQYALSKRLFSKPSQTLLIFDGNNLINHSIELE